MNSKNHKKPNYVSRYKVRGTLSGLILAAVGVCPAHAESVLEEIVVTASKSGATNLQSTPISITALTGDDLEKSQIVSSMGLQLKTPGLVMSRNTHQGQPYIRGIGTDLVGPALEGAVAMYLDGV